MAGFARGEDILEAMLQSIQGGELHVRPPLELGEGKHARHSFLEIGLALRHCIEDKSKHDDLIRRLKPHLSVIIGSLPASLKHDGLLPRLPAEHLVDLKFRPLQEISDGEIRQWLIVDGGLIYGELKRYELENYVDFVAALLPRGGTMYDLGSGLGKVVMSMALSLPFSRCIGVEILSYRHRMAMDRLNNMLLIRDRGLASMAANIDPEQALRLPSGDMTTINHLLDAESRIEFVQKNMFEQNLSDANLVFIYSTCFAPLMPKLADKLARELHEQALVSTTTFQIRHPGFELVKHFPSRTLAWTDVYFYRRIAFSESMSSAESVALFEPDPQEWESRVRQELAALG